MPPNEDQSPDEQTIDRAGLIPGSGTSQPVIVPAGNQGDRLQAGLNQRTENLQGSIEQRQTNLGTTLGFGGSITPSDPQQNPVLGPGNISDRAAQILGTPSGGGQITIRGETTTLRPDGTLLDTAGNEVGQLPGFRSEAPPNDVEALVGTLQTAGEKLIAGRALRNQKEARDSLSADLKQRQGEVRSLRKEQTSLMDQISSLNKAADNEDRRANRVESGSTFEATGSTLRQNAAQAAQKRRLATQLRNRAAQLQAQLGPSQDNIDRTRDQASELRQNQGKAGEDEIAEAALRIEADREARSKTGTRSTNRISPFPPDPVVVKALSNSRQQVRGLESQTADLISDFNENPALLGNAFGVLALSAGITSIGADFETGTLVGVNEGGNRVAGANLIAALGNTAQVQEMAQAVSDVSEARRTEDTMSILALSSAPPGVTDDEFVAEVRRRRDNIVANPGGLPLEAINAPTAWAVRLVAQDGADILRETGGGGVP